MKIDRPLRLAVLINSDQLAAWQYTLLDTVQRQGTAQLVVAIIRGNTQEDSTEPARHPLALSLFYRYATWDRSKFHASPDPFAAVPLSSFRGQFDTVTMTPDTTRWSDSLNAHDLEKLQQYDLDVIVRLGWRILKGGLLQAARCGVWSYHHGDNRVNRGGPPAVWEHYHGHACAGVTLQILSEQLDGGQVVSRSLTATDKVSPAKTRSKLYWRSADMLPRALQHLKQVGYSAFIKHIRADNAEPEFYSYPLLSERKMTLLHVARYAVHNIAAYIRQALYERFYEEKWVLYFNLSQQLSTSLWQFHKIESPNDRYWADPHIIKRDGVFYIFVEEFLYATRRGRIAVIPVNEHGHVGEAKTILSPDYHLSYPFVFEYDGNHYMIPESGENRTIELYRCTRFPYEWQLEKVLMQDVHAVDTTLLYRDGRWWMFTNLCTTDGGNTHDELHLFHADTLFSDEWLPHPENVIVSDASHARSAGALFQIDETLYRPAQDCTVDYGYAVQLQAISALNLNTYNEHNVSTITPDWHHSVKGVHTLNYVDGMTIVDAKTFIRQSSLVK